MYYSAGGTFSAPNVSNNTFPFSASGRVSYVIHGSSAPYYNIVTELINGGTVHQNYFDLRGVIGAFYPNSMKGWTGAANRNMDTSKNRLI
jgi:hypothetical protein